MGSGEGEGVVGTGVGTDVGRGVGIDVGLEVGIELVGTGVTVGTGLGTEVGSGLLASIVWSPSAKRLVSSNIANWAKFGILDITFTCRIAIGSP